MPDGPDTGCSQVVYGWKKVIEVRCDHKAGKYAWSVYFYCFEKYCSAEHNYAPVPEFVITWHNLLYLPFFDFEFNWNGASRFFVPLEKREFNF